MAYLKSSCVHKSNCLSADVDSYEDGDGQALRDTLNRCELNCTAQRRI